MQTFQEIEEGLNDLATGLAYRALGQSVSPVAARAEQLLHTTLLRDEESRAKELIAELDIETQRQVRQMLRKELGKDEPQLPIDYIVAGLQDEAVMPQSQEAPMVMAQMEELAARASRGTIGINAVTAIRSIEDEAKKVPYGNSWRMPEPQTVEERAQRDLVSATQSLPALHRALRTESYTEEDLRELMNAAHALQVMAGEGRQGGMQIPGAAEALALLHAPRNRAGHVAEPGTAEATTLHEQVARIQDELSRTQGEPGTQFSSGMGRQLALIIREIGQPGITQQGHGPE